MRRFTSIMILLACLALLPAASNAALFFDDTLVSIDENSYTVDDFKRWWKYWKEKDSPLPKTPDPYIDWLLLSMEAERMELDNDPGFKRATRVFLQSRTLLMLKYESVDSQINITDADIKNCSGLSPRALTNKVFGAIEYDFEQCSTQPYILLGGEAEFASKVHCVKTAISQWGIWIEGGFSY